MKTSKALKSTVSYPNDMNMHFPPTQTPHGGPKLNLLTESCNEVDQALSTKAPAHQPTLDLDDAAHEQSYLPSIRTAAHVRRQDRVDEENSSRVKMWDPVKDCSDPHSIQADVPGFLPARHSSNEQFVDSTVSELASMGLHFSYGNHPYGQVQDSQEHFMNSEIRGAVWSGLSPGTQSQPLASVFQPSVSTDSQQLHLGHLDHQLQRSRRVGHENLSILPSHFRNPSGQDGQQSLDSMNIGATLMGIQPHQTGNSHGHFQERDLQVTGVESSSVASHESPPRPLLPSMTLNLSTQGSSGLQQADYAMRQMPSAEMSQALSMAHYAERMDEESNRTEALRAYEQACALFQDLIIRSCSLEDRMGYNDARNICLARLDSLLRESPASPLSAPPRQNDEQEDDGLGGGKPQYSLFEDMALCRKAAEELSWQDIAETSVFKGRRKHRSLSQRKHTIGKMGPKYNEAEAPWTEDEDRKLCALGDAGKTLGDIHRKFRNRNAERCLNRYFYLKGYYNTRRSRTHTTRQLTVADTLMTQHTQDPSVIARHPAHGFIDQPPYSGYQISPSSSQNDFTGHIMRDQMPRAPFMSSSFSSTASMSSNNATPAEALTVRTQGSPNSLTQQRLAVSTLSSSSSSPFSGTKTPEHPTPSMSALMVYPSGKTYDGPPSQEPGNNESTICHPTTTPQRSRPSVSSLSSELTANSLTDSTSNTSSLSSSAMMLSPLEGQNPPDKIWKPR